MGEIEPQNEGPVTDEEKVVRFAWQSNHIKSNGTPRHYLFKPPKKSQDNQSNYSISLYRNYDLEHEEIKQLAYRRILQKGRLKKIVGWATIQVINVRYSNYPADFVSTGPPRHVDLSMNGNFEDWQQFAQALANFYTDETQILETPLTYTG